MPPSKSTNSRGKKRGNQHHNKNPARGNISSIPLSEEHCWEYQEKKFKTPTKGV
jgi:hypothetical protein